MSDPDGRRSWNRFCALIAVLFMARGLLLLSFFPPLEGADEYQHIAYLVFVHERGATPVYQRATVPLSLYPDLVEQPHSTYDWQQTKHIGALRYKHFPFHVPRVLSREPIGIYQAQHPPLYYRLLSPLYARLRDRLGFRPAVYAVRFLNIVFGGAALALLLHPLWRIFGYSWRTRLAALVISLLPMTLVYVCRVSNDALAMLFAGLAVVVLAGVADGRSVPLRCAAAGALLGFGVWTKLTVFGFFPAALFWIGLLAVLRWLPLRRALLGGAALAGAYLVVAGGYHLASLREFGTPFRAGETVRNAAAGLTWVDLLNNVKLDQIRSFFWERMVVGNLWTSGWSFLKPSPVWTGLYKGFFALAGAGAVAGLLRCCARGKKAAAGPSPGASADPGCGRRGFAQALQFGLVVGFSLLAAYAHGLNSISAYGGIVTPAHYVIPGFPALLALAFVALDGFGSRRLWFAAVAGLGCLFVATEYHSLLTVALPHWSYSGDPGVIWQRAVATHPLFPSPWASPGLALVLGALLTVAVRLVPATTWRQPAPPARQ